MGKAKKNNKVKGSIWVPKPKNMIGTPVNGELAAYIENLQKANTEIRESRRALLNALEDAVLSKDELYHSDEKYRLKLEQEVRDRTQEIKTRQQQYSSLVENTPDVITRWDKDLRLIFANKAFRKRTGLSNKTTYGKTIQEIMELRKLSFPFKEGLQNVFEAAEPAEQFYSIPSPEGELYFYLTIVPERNEAGEVITVLGIDRDITEIKKSEQEIRSQAHFLKMISETNPDMISVINLETNEIEFSNQGSFLEQGSGTEALPYEKMKPEIRRSSILSDDKPLTENYFKAFRTMNDTDIQTIEYRAINNKGELHWYFSQGKVFKRNEKGIPTHCINLVHKITEQKIAEQEIKDQAHFILSVTDSAPAIISLTTFPEGRTFFSNRDPLTALGFDAGEFTKMNLDERLKLVHREDIQKLKDYYNAFESLNDDQEIRIEYRIRNKSGEWIWLDTRGKIFKRNEEGKVSQILHIAQDITLQKKAEQEIIRLKDELVKKTTDKYYSLFNSIDEGFTLIELILDENGKVVDYWHREVNPVFTKITGINNPVSKRMSDLVPGLEPEWYRMLEKIYYTGEPIRIEYPVEELGHWYNTHMSRVGDEGSRLIACVYDDITERKQREQQQEFLLELSDAIRPLSDSTAILNEAMRILRSHLRSTLVAYSEVSKDEKFITPIAEDHEQGFVSILGTSFRFTDLEPEGAARFRQRESVGRNDIQSDSNLPDEMKAAFAEIGIGSYMATPLVKEGKLVACLAGYFNTAHKWSMHEIHLLEETAERIWVAIDKAKVEEALRKSEDLVAEELADTKILHLLSKIVIEENDVIEEIKIIEENKVIEEKTITIYKQILEAAMDIMHSDMGSIQMYDSEKEELVLKWHENFHPESAAYWKVVTADSSSTYGIALAKAERVIITDLDKYESLKGTKDEYYYKLSGIQSVQSTPVISRSGKILGMFSNHWKQPYQPSQQKLRLLDVLARQAADVIDKKLAEDALLRNRLQLGQELKDTKKLQEISTKIIEEENTGELYKSILETAISFMRSDMGSFQILDSDSNILILQEYKNFHPKSAEFWHTVPAASGSISGEALRNHKRITVSDIEQEESAKDELEIFRLSGIRAVQSTPLISSSGKCKGMLNTQWKQPRSFSEQDFRYLDILSRQAADFIERKQGELLLKEFNIELENQVAERTAELKRSNEDLRQFAHVASHDLKEPARKIKTFNTRLIDEFDADLPKRAKGYAIKVDESVNRMLSMIDGVLKYSKQESEKFTPETIDLNSLINQIKIDLELMMEKKKATITTSYLPVISGQSILIYQLFYNLILNSLKFAKEATPMQINISSEEIIKNDKKYFQITLKDNGIGFEEKYAKEIFKTFSRLHSTYEYEGTGLGLALCKKIVARHNGFISAFGKPDQGAIFTILLPA
jgi:PAS domain S-box-containing protein